MPMYDNEAGGVSIDERVKGAPGAATNAALDRMSIVAVARHEDAAKF